LLFGNVGFKAFEAGVCWTIGVFDFCGALAFLLSGEKMLKGATQAKHYPCSAAWAIKNYK
jgi:hypothetical protein